MYLYTVYVAVNGVDGSVRRCEPHSESSSSEDQEMEEERRILREQLSKLPAPKVQLFLQSYAYSLPSVLWRCWLGGRKGIRPVKTEWWGAGMVICLELGADLHMAQLIPLPLTVSCFIKIQIGFYLSGTGSPG